MAANTRNDIGSIHAGRFIVAVFALIVAAAHLASNSGGVGSSHFQAPPSNQIPSGTSGFSQGFNYVGFWTSFEVVVYTVIAIVFLLGLRTWYVPSIAFNVFNLGIYFISGVTAIPGITATAFGGRLAVFSSFSTMSLIVVGWVAVLLLGIIMIKYDRGSELDKMLVTKRA